MTYLKTVVITWRLTWYSKDDLG